MNRKNTFFTKQLLYWHSYANNRSLPWKQEPDPYRIWLSEIILQQTRAEQGLPYYLRFTEQYPAITDLANARDEDVFRLWQGLGYYNRCKNMIATARLIATQYQGQFPGNYEGILGLKGIGPYTAAAIGSFAFGLPLAVVDGNVYRVLSRYFGIDTAIDTTQGKQQFATLADELLDRDNSAAYNQAIMDFGATVCTPKAPACTSCPLQPDCSAYRQDMVALLPVKSKKLTVRNRYFNYVLMEVGAKIWLRKRKDRDIWENLHEPLLIETDQPLSWQELRPLLPDSLQQQETTLTASGKQRLTHQLIESRLYTLVLTSVPAGLPDDGFWISKQDLDQYAFPKTLSSFMAHV